MIEVPSPAQQVQDRVRWKWFLAVGVLLLFLGLAGVGATALLQLTSLLVFGPLLLVSSLLHFLVAFFDKDWKESLFHLGGAGVQAILGFLIMAQPFDSVSILIVLIAIGLMLSGLLRLIRSCTSRLQGTAWFIMTGVIAVVLGVLVWLGWPIAQLWFVGLCIAIDFICLGIGWSALAVTERLSYPAHVP